MKQRAGKELFFLSLSLFGGKLNNFARQPGQIEFI
jgi:hypothetical protein